MAFNLITQHIFKINITAVGAIFPRAVLRTRPLMGEKSFLYFLGGYCIYSVVFPDTFFLKYIIGRRPGAGSYYAVTWQKNTFHFLIVTPETKE